MLKNIYFTFVLFHVGRAGGLMVWFICKKKKSFSGLKKVAQLF